MTDDAYRQRVYKRVENDCVMGDDGYHVYWPPRMGGFITSHDLRIIADYLDAKNKDWDEQVQRDTARLAGEK